MDLYKETIEILNSISKIPFVKTALNEVICKKLLRDGYICCSNGIVPSNKDNLKSKLKKKNSDFCSILDTNAKSFPELLTKFNEVQKVVQFVEPNREESIAIIYSIIKTHDTISVSERILTLLRFHLVTSGYDANEDFIFARGIELSEVTSLSSFVEILEKDNDSNTTLYRGHSNINYQVVPSLFRDKKYYTNEYSMYQEIVLRCPEAFISCMSHLDFLVEMQHYGLPTRLLDFTFNPLIALYFACENQECIGEVIRYSPTEILYEKDEKIALLSCLPMLDYKRLQWQFKNLVQLDTELIDQIRIERPSFSGNTFCQNLVWPRFVKPPRKNKRIAHQEGAFMIFGLESEYYDESPFAGKEKHWQMGRKKIYYIRPNTKERILTMLNHLGINRAFVYPEIDDVATYVKDQVK